MKAQHHHEQIYHAAAEACRIARERASQTGGHYLVTRTFDGWRVLSWAEFHRLGLVYATYGFGPNGGDA